MGVIRAARAPAWEAPGKRDAARGRLGIALRAPPYHRLAPVCYAFRRGGATTQIIDNTGQIDPGCRRPAPAIARRCRSTICPFSIAGPDLKACPVLQYRRRQMSALWAWRCGVWRVRWRRFWAGVVLWALRGWRSLAPFFEHHEALCGVWAVWRQGLTTFRERNDTMRVASAARKAPETARLAGGWPFPSRSGSRLPTENLWEARFDVGGSRARAVGDLRRL
jgi:hypothetical protein